MMEKDLEETKKHIVIISSLIWRESNQRWKRILNRLRKKWQRVVEFLQENTKEEIITQVKVVDEIEVLRDQIRELKTNYSDVARVEGAEVIIVGVSQQLCLYLCRADRSD